MIATIAIAIAGAALLLVALAAPSASDPRRLFRRRSEEGGTVTPRPQTAAQITWPSVLGLGALDDAERFQVALTLQAVDLPTVPLAIRRGLEEEVDPQIRELLLGAAASHPSLFDLMRL